MLEVPSDRPELGSPNVLDRRAWWLLAGATMMIAMLLGGELYQDDEPLTPLNLGLELLNIVLVVGSSMTSTLLVLRVQAQEADTRYLRTELDAVKAQSARWREEMAEPLREVAMAIRRQFEFWHLTEAEQDV